MYNFRSYSAYVRILTQRISILYCSSIRVLRVCKIVLKVYFPVVYPMVGSVFAYSCENL
jgi:hypothetical protein